MLDFEDYSLGHQDLPSNKYYSTVNVCPSPTTMDLLLSAGDSVSFNDMLDLDIKAEIDTVLGGHSDFASFNFGDFPPLDMDDSPSDNMWFTNNSNHSNSNFNIDFIGSEAAAMMVNPNSVMPLTLVTTVPSSKPPTPTIETTKRNQKIITTTTSSPATNNTTTTTQTTTTFSPIFKLTDIKQEVKKEPIELKKPLGKTIKVSSNSISNSRSIIRTSQDIKGHSLLNIKSAIQKQLVTSSNFSHLSNVRVVTHGRKQQFNNNRHYGGGDDVKEYPKPAYSYSCLIAMALKNSRTGSLPVSEIYNFMCEHFPYFKTAPNGWKNSVRHNLSLNKCFEKIEKPAVSGAQRKGCLWAMNPAKISKMDEEVQKWSRKDPSAIRKAMINPEHLEALERGELKYNCRNSGENEDGYGNDSSADTEEEEEEEGGEEQEDDGGSDVEVEDRLHEIQALNFVNVNDGDEECGFDIEVADNFYENEGDDQPTIKIEMEVVDNDLLEYIDSPNKKRSRSILEIDENFGGRRIYQVQAQNRRKTTYLIKNE